MRTIVAKGSSAAAEPIAPKCSSSDSHPLRQSGQAGGGGSGGGGGTARPDAFWAPASDDDASARPSGGARCAYQRPTTPPLAQYAQAVTADASQ